MLVIIILLVSAGFDATSSYSVPCPFNTLCSCGSNTSVNGVPDHKSLQVFNEIHCNLVPFTRLPVFPSNNVTKLSIVGSGLRVVDESALSDTNLKSVNLANNKLIVISTKAFQYSTNVEALDLSYNHLQAVPTVALQNLYRLKLLSLERNEIPGLMVNWGTLLDTVKSLFLGGNDIKYLPLSLDYSLANFRNLISLKLDDNYIEALERTALPDTLVTLSASRNFITEFPTEVFSNLKDLKKLYLSNNHIENVFEICDKKSKSVDVLDISNNLIRALNEPLAQEGRLAVKEMSLSNNRIQSVNSKAFVDVVINSLDLSYNKITTMSDRSLNPLSSVLTVLDLSSNGLEKVPKTVLALKKLKKLSLSQNNLKHMPETALKNSSTALTTLILSHNEFNLLPRAMLSHLKKMEYLDFGYNQIAAISGLGSHWVNNLKSLTLTSNSIAEIRSSDFKHATRLETLNLDLNEIVYLSEEAFTNLNRLKSLDLGFSFRLNFTLSTFKGLPRLQHIYLDNNNLTGLPTDSYFSRSLLYINLDFNLVQDIPPTLISTRYPFIEDVRLSFNRIEVIRSSAFKGFYNLRQLTLDHNRIRGIDKFAFADLHKPVVLVLSHNRISNISSEAFVNIPNLAELDLHDNDLTEIDWNIFKNVSTSLSPMTLNLSQNRLESSWYDIKVSNKNSAIPIAVFVMPKIYVKSLDLSHNSYKSVPHISLQAVNESLKAVNLGYNFITGLSDSAFIGQSNIEVLNLEHNNILEFGSQAFWGLKNLQILDMSHNHISRLLGDQFSDNDQLRVLDLSYNLISAVPSDCFKRTKLEKLILSHNQLVTVPVQALLPIGHTLSILDLSHNKIQNMDPDQFTNSPLLTELNLCGNSLTELQDNVFRNLNSLVRLELCHNRIGSSLDTFYHNVSLQYLNLAHTGLEAMPMLQQANLVSLNVSGNGIRDLKIGFLFGVPKLRRLDLSNNNLTNWTNVDWDQAENLVKLDLSSNPIKILTRENFKGLHNLRTLNLQNLPNLERFDSDSLLSCERLTWMKVQTWPNIEKYRFRLAALLSSLKYLHKVSVDVREPELTDQLVDAFPPKLTHIEITGRHLVRVSSGAFKGLTPARDLSIRFSGTRVSEFPPLFFARLRATRLNVDLRNNQIQSIDPDAFYYKSNLQKYGSQRFSGGIHVQDNPIICNCGASWFGHWLRRYMREVLHTHTKGPKYYRDVIREMLEVECSLETGEKYNVLTYELNECTTDSSPPLVINTLLLFTGFLVSTYSLSIRFVI